ncbi:hypothetical protein [Deinococcus petrolearius]|uniref:Uncharacterized protein n=1 Tax=Deinococcus petrolearius TaxID=1751295 RepID=A0ABW1DP50_9DEIO
MRPADLTPVEIADLLTEAYSQDRRGHGSLKLDTRTALADYLGCDEDVRAEEAAEYWLDVEFIQPCPRDQAHA